MCLFVCAASAVAIDSTEKKQEKRGVLGVGLAGGYASPLGLGHAGLVGPGIVAPAGIVGSPYGLGASYGLGAPYGLGLSHGLAPLPIAAHAPIGLSHSTLGLAHAPIGLSHSSLGLAHAPIGYSTASYGYGAPLGLHGSLVGSPLGLHSPLGLGHTSLGLSHGLYGGSTIIH